MSKRSSKKRTLAKAKNDAKAAATSNTVTSRGPKSMVIRVGAGEVGPSISQLVQDVRSMMEPDTAVKLRVCFPLPFSTYLTATGAQIESFERLYSYGRTSRRFSSPTFLTIAKW